jgi:hypothetical protein
MDVAEQLKLPPPLPMFNYAELLGARIAPGQTAEVQQPPQPANYTGAPPGAPQQPAAAPAATAR